MAEYTVIHVDDVPITSDNYQFDFFPSGIVATRLDKANGRSTFFPWHQISCVESTFGDLVRYLESGGA